jgi:hypothetical protein
MYMLTNYGGSGLQVVTPDPPNAGGAAINANFKALFAGNSKSEARSTK